MASRSENIGPMWAAMKAAGLDLEPSVPLSKNVYLGCGQMDVEPDLALIRQKLESFQKICFGEPSGKTEGNLEDLLENPGGDTAAKSPKKKSKKTSQRTATSPGVKMVKRELPLRNPTLR